MRLSFGRTLAERAPQAAHSARQIDGNRHGQPTYATLRMVRLPRSSLRCSLVVAGPRGAGRGRVVDARSGAPVAGAEITIVGQRGSVRTDAAGRFQWEIAPLAADRRHRRASRWPRRAADPGRRRSTARRSSTSPSTRRSVRPSRSSASRRPIDASPAASTTLLTSRDLDLRHLADIEPGDRRRPGRGRDRRRSSGGAGDSRAGARADVDPGRRQPRVDRAPRRRECVVSRSAPSSQTIEVARGPASVAYGSDAFGGVIAARTRGPDYARPLRVRFAGTVGVRRARAER